MTKEYKTTLNKLNAMSLESCINNSSNDKTIIAIDYTKIGYNTPSQANWSYGIYFVTINYIKNDNKFSRSYIVYDYMLISSLALANYNISIISKNAYFNKLSKFSLKNTAGSLDMIIKQLLTDTY
jgi:hypothetical protein